MVVSDFLWEIWEGVKMKPSRTILTGIGISWGMFILILLVGVGSGFEKGVLKLFDGYSKSATYVIATHASKSYKGTPSGKNVLFRYEDLNMLKNTIPEITYISPEVSRMEIVTYSDSKSNFEVRGVCPDYFRVKLLEAEEGRMLNIRDMKEKRKTVVIGSNVADLLFKHSCPISKMISIRGEIYQVVGVIKKNMMTMNEDRIIYMPYSTLLSNDSGVKYFTTLVFSSEENVNLKEVNDRVRIHLTKANNIAPDDENAFFFSCMEEQVNAFKRFFDGLKKVLWFMGISTLLSGVIGVANIMYTAAKERTRIIGIQKALGAKSSYIKSMYICESVAITFVAGGIGIIIGWICLKIIGLCIDDSVEIIQKPDIDFTATIIALFIIMLFGTLAGVRPAVYASKLRPIDALKEEN